MISTLNVPMDPAGVGGFRCEGQGRILSLGTYSSMGQELAEEGVILR